MYHKWNKQDNRQETEGQPVGQSITIFQEAQYRPKLSKVPSMRAMDKYNSIETDNFNSYDNLSYTPEGSEIVTASYYKSSSLTPTSITNSYDYATTTSVSTINDNRNYLNSLDNGTIIYPNNHGVYDCSISPHSIIEDNRSEVGSRKEDVGSTSKLVSSSTTTSCRSCFTYAETVLCTISLAAGLGNLYRLPQTALIRGGLPFLVAYIILSLTVGLPLLFLELGLGQLAQEGFTKIWRAVPLFRGVGCIKFVALFLLCVYYPLYMGLFSYYLIWLSSGPPPFPECASVKITEAGYKAEGISGQLCLQKTFLESPFVDPKWYGIYVGLLFLIWIIIATLLIGRTRTYVKSLAILLLPCLGCLIALTIKTLSTEKGTNGLETFTKDIDWSLLTSANTWYYALIQVFFSTNLGFGPFVTNAGIIFNKVNTFWIALSFIVVNLIFGIISVISSFTLTREFDPTGQQSSIAELHLVSLIYDSGRVSENLDIQTWTIVAYTMLLLSGCINMITIVYTLLKAVRVETRQKWSWCKTNLVLSLIGFILGAAILLSPNFMIVHLLDHYVVGNIVLICTILEVFAIVAFYGSKRIKLDFEFILGKTLSTLWIGFWWFVPVVILGLFIWALTTLPLTGIWIEDPIWLYGLGWAIIIAATSFIFAMSCYQIFKQDEYYTFYDKLVAVTKPLRKWGPVDPIMRYSWVQWHSKAKAGERDFTLKRRWTKDYTHSVKKRREPYVSTMSDGSTLSRASHTSYDSNDHNQNSIDTLKSTYGQPLQIDISCGYDSRTTCSNSGRCDVPLQSTIIVGTQDSPGVYSTYVTNANIYSNPNMKRTHNINPLSLNNGNNDLQNESSTSEGYGTFRKGPYIIPDEKLDHICYRKYSENEISTEL